MFGKLPNRAEMEQFKQVIAESRDLPTNFTRDVIMKAPSADIMNSMTKSVLTLASYDKKATVLDLDNVLRQSNHADQHFLNAGCLWLSCIQSL